MKIYIGKKNKIVYLSGLIICCLWSMTPAMATNGTNMTAYGARSAGMGGATLAVGGSVMDLQANPSQLSRLQGAIFESGGQFLKPVLGYQDGFIDEDPYLTYTNKVQSESAVFPVPYIGYAAPIGKNMGWGIAFYGQGGMGAEFKGIRRPMANPGGSPFTLNSMMGQMFGIQLPGPIGDIKTMTENTYSNVSIAKLTPGFSIRLGEKLHVGLALDFVASKMEWRWTFSDPMGMIEMPGAGYRYKSDPAYSLSGKVGLTYEVTDSFTLAYAYQARTRSYFNGKMSINAGAAYIPSYQYGYMDATGTKPGNASILNLAPSSVSMYLDWPEEHTVGLSIKSGAITVGLDVGYVNWGSYFKTVDFYLDQPYIQTPFQTSQTNLTFTLNWRDQTVVAIGLEYKPDKLAFRVGYNYGRSPVAEQGINPLFPAITEHHAFVGFGYVIGKLEIDFAFEYAFKARQESSDMNDWEVFHVVFGPPWEDFDNMRTPYYQSSITMYQMTPHIGVKYKF